MSVVDFVLLILGITTSCRLCVAYFRWRQSTLKELGSGTFYPSMLTPKPTSHFGVVFSLAAVDFKGVRLWNILPKHVNTQADKPLWSCLSLGDFLQKLSDRPRVVRYTARLLTATHFSIGMLLVELEHVLDTKS